MELLPKSKGILVGQTLQFNVNGGVAPYTFSLGAGAGTITAEGLFTASLTAGSVLVHVEDAMENFAEAVVMVNPGLEIIPITLNLKTNKTHNFAAAGGVAPYKFSLSSSSSGSINAGTGEYTAPNSPGVYQVQVRDNEGNVATGTVSVSSSGGGNQSSSEPADHLALVSGDNQTGSVMAVLPTSLQVHAEDVSGNPVAGVSLKVTVSLGNGNPGYTTITTDNSGLASTPFFLGTTAGLERIRIEASGTPLAGTPAFIEFSAVGTPGAPSSSTSTIAANPSVGNPADGLASANITVSVKDIYGNLIPNLPVSLSSTGSGNFLGQMMPSTDSAGQVTATLKSLVAENKTLSFMTPIELSTLTTTVGFGPTVVPDITKSNITSSGNVVADGVSTALIVINLKSPADEPASGYIPTFVATDTNGTNTYGNCSLSDSAGNSNCTLTSTKAEVKILTILTPVNKAGGAVTFLHGSVQKLAFSQQPVTAAVTTALSPQPIVELQDVFGNRVTTGAEASATVNLTLLSGVGTMAGLATMASVGGVADFNGKGLLFDRAGSKVIKAALGGLTVDSLSFAITSTVNKIQWSGNTSISRGTCASLNLTSYDASDDITATTTDMNITLGGGGAGGFFSDASCTNGIVSTTMSQGTSGKAIYYLNNTTGNQTLTADATTFATANYSVAVVPGAPSKLVISGPNLVGIGRCAALTITAKDQSDQATTVVTNTALSLAGQGSGQLFSDGNCSLDITTITITAGTSSNTIYFKNNTPETVTLTANATGLSQGNLVIQAKYPDLVLSGIGGSTLDGVAITSCGGGDVCNSTNPFNPHALTTVTQPTPLSVLNFNSITMVDGASMSTGAWLLANGQFPGSGVLDLTVQGNFSICNSCVVDVSGKGYSTDQGPGKGLTGGSGGGGSYGGQGGISSTGLAGGNAYGAITSPAELGSGGGTASVAGGSGGGLVVLNILGTLTLNGKIYARGGTGSGTAGFMCNGGTSSGGGAGGGVKVTVNTIAGTGGMIHASGGAAVNYCGYIGGGGSGGRIALQYVVDNYANGVQNIDVVVNGGTGANHGSSGSVYLKNMTTLIDSLVFDQNNGQAAVTFLTQNTTVNQLTIRNNAHLEIPAGVSLNVTGTGTYIGGLMTNRGTLINPISNLNWTLYNYGTITYQANSLTIQSGGNLTDYVTNNFDSVTIQTGGTQVLAVMPTAYNQLQVEVGALLTHLPNTSTKSYWIDINANDFQLNGTIDVSGKGFVGSQGPGKGNNGTLASGGASMGQGGNSSSGVIGGNAYTSFASPNQLGSGGGTSGVAGGAGGGLVKVNVSGLFTFNGKIFANGVIGPGYSGSFCNTHYSSGGGGGGGVYITTGTIAGGGSAEIQAKGGSSVDSCGGTGGGGGGGAIALYYGADTYVGGIESTGLNASGSYGATYGSAGTIYLKNTTSMADHLILDQFNGGAEPTSLAQNTTVTNLTIKNKGHLKIVVGMSLNVTGAMNMATGTVTNQGTLVNPISSLNWTLYNYGTVTYPSNNLTIQAGGHLIDFVTSSFANVVIQNGGLQTLAVMPTTYNQLDVQSGAVLTHLANSNLTNYWLDINANDLILTGNIDVSGKGFAGAQGPGKGNDGSYGGGGAYGGPGGSATGSILGGLVYGSRLAPNELGSGGGVGGVSGGAGGGLVKMNVSGTLTLNGKIFANGAVGPGYSGPFCNASYAAGGGSGGGVRISTGTLVGTGTGAIQAKGGDSTAACGGRGGGGGGGRIALNYTTDSYTGGIQMLSLVASGGIGTANGTSGSIQLKPTKLGWSGVVSSLAGSCSGLLSVNTKDITNQPSLVSSDTVIALAGQGTGGFYSDSGCTNGVSQVTIASETSSANVYFKTNSIESLNFTADALGLSQGTVSFQSTNPGAGIADHLVAVAGDNQTGTVMSVLPSSFRVQAVDNSGNAVAGVSLKVTVTLGNGNSGFATLTTDSNGFASTPFFLGSTAGAETIRIDSAGTAFPGNPAFIDFTATGTPGSAANSTSTIIASPNANIPADGSTTTTITATLKDIYGNPISNAAVTLSASGGGNTLTPGSPTTDSSGVVTATLASTVAGNKTLGFTVPAALSSLNSVAGFGTTVTPDPTKSTIVGTNNIIADGVASSTITITLLSSADEPASGFMPTFTATDSNGTNTYGTCSFSDGLGVSTCTLTSTRAEAKILNLLTPVNKIGGGVTFLHGEANKLVFTQQPVASTINVAMNPQPIIEVQDVFGNRVAAGAGSSDLIVLTLNAGNGALAGIASMNAVAGIADFVSKNLSLDRSGAKELKATMNAYTKVSASFTITAPASQIAWTGSSSFARGSCTPLTVSTLDANTDSANVLADFNITLGGAGSGGFYSDSGCVNPIAGTVISQGTNSKLVYYLNTTNGNYSLTADGGGLPQAVHSVNIIAGPPSKLVWSGANFSVVGMCSKTLTITTQDSISQATNVTLDTIVSLGGGSSGQFYSEPTCTNSINDLTISAGTNSANLYFKGPAVESLILTASTGSLTQGTYPFEARFPILYLSGTVAATTTIDGVAINSVRPVWANN
jgi:hypothetical protein